MIRKRNTPSGTRRWVRTAIWTTFAVVMIVRFFHRSERSARFGPGPEVFAQNRQFRRPPARVHPPAVEVPTNLWRIHIEIVPKDVEKLRAYYWNGWRGARTERPEVSATVREGGVVYTNVALHLKGAAGSFRPFDDKPALTLNFSKNASNQRLHGFSKISLNNSVQDPSYLSEAIAREMFEAAGVPVPRAGHATVLINGRDLGLYVMTEGFGKTFLKRYFKNVKGNLYDGGFCQEINGNLNTNSGDNPDDRSDINRLIQAATTEQTNRWPRLNQVLDMDRFLSFIAMEVLTCHWDGYGMNRNNYRLFHDLEKDRMVFMPHGLDQMFGWGRSSPNSSIDPPMNGLVARAVATTQEGRRRYFERLAALRTNVFLEEKLTSRVRELSHKIRPTLAAYAPELAAEHDAHVENLCQRITARAQSVTAQLAAPKEPIPFNGNGGTGLSRWTPAIKSQQTGLVRFGKEQRDGKSVLRIAASRGGGTGSWRTRVLLPSGRYRFEGRARTMGVGNSGGICLRISGDQGNSTKTSDAGWTQLRCFFTIEGPSTEVELICELRAAQGEAWFDEESLRLTRE